MKTFLRGFWKKRESEVKPLTLPIREFVYLDRQKVEDFVSALLAGLPLERTEVATSKPSEVTGSIGVSSTKISLKKGSRELTREELVKATDASLFEQLHQILEMEKRVKKLEAFSVESWEHLGVGEFIEVKAKVELSALEKVFDLMKWIKEMESIFPDKTKSKSAAQRQGWQSLIKYLDMLSEERETYNIRITPIIVPSEEFLFGASLPRTNTRVTKEELPDEYTVFGRVRRKLIKGEKFPLFHLFPLGIQLPEQDIDSFLDVFKDVTTLLGSPVGKEDLQISYPAIILTPVAIFR
jgi:hypothetical protein